jgi:hypothetical protein
MVKYLREENRVPISVLETEVAPGHNAIHSAFVDAILHATGVGSEERTVINPTEKSNQQKAAERGLYRLVFSSL